MSTFAKFRLTASCLCVALLVVLSLMPAEDMMRTGAPKGFEHFLAYFLTSLIATFGVHLRDRVRTAIGLMILSAILEGLQSYSPGRTPHLSDFLASSAGAFSGAALTAILMSAFASRRTVE